MCHLGALPYILESPKVVNNIYLNHLIITMGREIIVSLIYRSVANLTGSRTFDVAFLFILLYPPLSFSEGFDLRGKYCITVVDNINDSRETTPLFTQTFTLTYRYIG